MASPKYAYQVYRGPWVIYDGYYSTRKEAEARAKKERRGIHGGAKYTIKKIDLAKPDYRHPNPAASSASIPCKLVPMAGGKFRVMVAAKHARRMNPSGTKLPGLSSWSTYAGGTGAAEGKRGYDYRTSKQTYSIDPYTTKYGRHAGYFLTVYPGDPARGHQRLGSFRSPQAAVSAAKKWAMEHD